LSLCATAVPRICATHQRLKKFSVGIDTAAAAGKWREAIRVSVNIVAGR
jgi:hypothetical protein